MRQDCTRRLRGLNWADGQRSTITSGALEPVLTWDELEVAEARRPPHIGLRLMTAYMLALVALTVFSLPVILLIAHPYRDVVLVASAALAAVVGFAGTPWLARQAGEATLQRQRATATSSVYEGGIGGWAAYQDDVGAGDGGA